MTYLADAYAQPASVEQGPLGPARRLDWRTPTRFFAAVDREFRFQLDACASAPIRPGISFIAPDFDGLWQSWAPGPVWLNPPYGRELPRWLEKAVQEQGRGVTVAALVPARLDTRWWHEWVMPYAHEVRAVEGRLAFDDGDSTAPFASVLVVYRGCPRLGQIVFRAQSGR